MIEWFNCFWKANILYGHPVHSPDGQDRLFRLGRLEKDGTITLIKPEQVAF